MLWMNVVLFGFCQRPIILCPSIEKHQLLLSRLLNNRFLSLESRYVFAIFWLSFVESDAMRKLVKQQILYTNMKELLCMECYYAASYCLLNSSSTETNWHLCLVPIRLLIFLLLTKEEERLGSLVVLVLERRCLLWNLSTMLPRLMVGSSYMHFS